MPAAARYLKFLIRLSGAGALLLGLAFWAGYAGSLLGLHLLLGIGLVLSLWTVAVIAWRTATRPGLAAGAFLWGAAVLVLGFAQSRLLPGSLHWIVAVAHLLAGGIAIGLGGALAAAVERSAAPEPARAPAWSER